HRDTEPLEERGSVAPESRMSQSVGKTFALEINRSEGQRIGYGKISFVQPLALPRLRGRKVDLEDANVGKGIAQGERVEASAEHHDLLCTSRDTRGQRILGEAAARH